MRGSDADELPGLGRKVEPEPPKPVEPVWKPMPGHQGYETDGKAVRRVPDPIMLNPWAEYMKQLGLVKYDAGCGMAPQDFLNVQSDPSLLYRLRCAALTDVTEMTPSERLEQRVSFVFGMVKSNLSRDEVRSVLCKHLGISD